MKGRAILRVLLPLALVACVTSGAWAKFERAVYYDTRVDTNWWNADAAKATRDFFVSKGYTEVNGETSVQWIKDRIADHARSVLVMAMDVITNQMGATADQKPDPNAVMRQYLNAGGKIVWVGDWPFYGHRDLTAAARSTDGWGGTGANVILGINGSDKGDINKDVVITDAGKAWGLVEPWQAKRSINNANAHVILAQGDANTASGWHRYYSFAGAASGFTRIYDIPSGNLPKTAVTDAVLSNIFNVSEYPTDAPDTLAVGGLNGTVKNNKGAPVGGVNLDFKNAAGLVVRVKADANGVFGVAAAPGDYTAVLTGEELNPASQTIKVTVPGVGQSANANITVGVTDAFVVDATNTTLAIRPGASAQETAPIAPAFDDSAWTAFTFAKKNTPAQPKIQGFWIRAKFTAPTDYPLNKASVLTGLAVDDNTHGVWLNGVALGNNRSGNSPGNLVIPAGTLKANNVLAILVWNTGGDIGLNSTMRVHTLQSAGTGAVRLVATGLPFSQSGVATSVRIGLAGADGKEIANASTNTQGVVAINNIPSGAYKATISGVQLDAPITQDVTVADGTVSEIPVTVLPAMALSTLYQPVGNPWKIKAAIDGTDNSFYAPGYDSSAWESISVPMDLKSGDRGTATVFGDNEWDVYRVTFKVPADWQALNRYMILESFNDDDQDRTYLNGVLLGTTNQWDADRAYPVPAELVKFGADNQLTIYSFNGSGGSGISIGDKLVRLRVANNSKGLVYGYVVGADTKPLAGGLTVSGLAADGTVTSTSTLAQGDFALQVAPGNYTVGTAGASQAKAVTVVGAQGARADLMVDAAKSVLNLTKENGFEWKIWAGPQVTGNEPFWATQADESAFKNFDVSDDTSKAGNWDVVSSTDNIYGWLRLTITPAQLPAEWKDKFTGKSLSLAFAFDDVDETYVNGVKVGKTGNWPFEKNGDLGGAWNVQRGYVIPAKLWNMGGTNVIAIKGFDGTGGGAFNGAPPRISPLSIATGPATLTKGDADFSGKADIADLRYALRAFVYGVKLTPDQVAALDMNGNGVIDLGDLILLLRQVVVAAP
ncbi:MAG TPA: beta galactosidase jelly roll domain-containing protein [Armatimonadota bacterium]|jgi:hypothetical protein